MVRFHCNSLARAHTIIVNPKNGKPAGMISKETYEIVTKNAEALDSAIIYNRDFNYNLCARFSIFLDCC